jgi:hypothetical protein
MAEQFLNGAEVGSRIVQVRGKAVAEGVGVDGFADAGAFGGPAASVPDHLVADGVVRGVIAAAGKQPYGRLAGEAAVMLAQFFVESGAERNLAVLAALAFANMDAHHRLVDVGDLKVYDLGASCAGAVGGHEQGAVVGGGGGVDEPGDLFHAQHQRQRLLSLGIRRVFHAPRLAEGFDVEEA